MNGPPPAYSGSEPFVFICYAHSDREIVLPELIRLHEAGFKLWYDEGIHPGSEWNAAIADAIEHCSAFVYFVSPGSVDSEHCRREINFALEEDCALLALHLEPTDMPSVLRLSISHRQAILKYKDNNYREKLNQALRSALAGESSPLGARDVHLGDYVLEINSRRITGHGKQIQLDPKDISVLLHLVDAAPEVVTTDALLSRSWPGTVVGDNALQQVITRLRRALNDDAKNPNYIATIPRQGYRLLMPVGDSTSGTTESVAGRPASSNPNSRWITGATALVVLITMCIGIWWWRQDTPVENSRILDFENRKSVAVLDFVDLSPGGDHAWLAEGMARELRQHMEVFENFDNVPAVLLRNRQINDLAGDVDIVVDGAIQVEGDDLDISIDATNLETGETLWAETFSGRGDDLLSLQKEVSAQIARYFDESIAGVAYWGPQNSSAYPHFLRYLKYSAGGQYEPSESALRLALKNDPEWIEGWWELAFELLFRAPTLRDMGRIEEARVALAKARSVSGNKQYGVELEAIILFFYEGKMREGAQLMADSGDYGQFSFLMHTVGLVNESKAFYQGRVESYPYSTTWDIVAIAEAYQGNWHQAVVASRKCAQFAPPSSFACYWGQVIALPRTDLAQAKQLLTDMQRAQARAIPGTATYIVNQTMVTSLEFGILMEESEIDPNRPRITQLIQGTTNNSAPLAGYLALMIGYEDRARREFADAEENAIFWRFHHRYYIARLTEAQRQNPIFLEYERALGFTPELRLEICEMANQFREHGLSCNPEDYQLAN